MFIGTICITIAFNKVEAQKFSSIKMRSGPKINGKRVYLHLQLHNLTNELHKEVITFIIKQMSMLIGMAR